METKSLLKQPYEVPKDVFIKGLIYGQPGIGKSTLAVSMPNPVLIDCDNGIHRIAPEHRPPYLPVGSYQEVLDVLASKEVAPFETIVIDTAGKLLDYMGQWIILDNPKMGRKDGALTLQGYGVRKYEFISLLKRVSIMGKHLIFVAHEVEERDNDSRYIRPEVGGSSGGDLIKELDIVGYMEALGRKRTVSFSPSDKYYAKNSAHLADMIEVPERAKGQANIFLGSIITQVKTAMEAETEQFKVYTALMADVEKSLTLVRDAKTANSFLASMSKTAPIWDSRTKTWNLLQAKATDLKLTFDAKGKKYAEATKSYPS